MPNRSNDFRKLVYLVRANLAARIPGARFMAPEGQNHMFLPWDPAAVRFVDEPELFLQES
jgi:hypothetical protein